MHMSGVICLSFPSSYHRKSGNTRRTEDASTIVEPTNIHEASEVCRDKSVGFIKVNSHSDMVPPK